jgi:predicted RND superfamily exporter protein
MALIVPAYLAYTSNSYYYGASHIFNSESRIGRDTEAITEAFGESDTYALLVPSGDSATQKDLSNELHHLPEVTSIISYVDTVGQTIPTSYLDKATLARLDSGNYSRMIISVAVGYEGDEVFELIEKVRDIAHKYYGDDYYLAGNGVSTYDLMDTITADMMKVNVVAIGAVFIVLLFTLKDFILPILLILGIETAIALNLSFPYFTGEPVFYVAYLIISSIQLGATVDYAILLTTRYRENRAKLDRKKALPQTVTDITSSVLVSGSVLAVVGMLMGIVSSNQLLAQLGIFIGRGAILSLIIVLFVMPGILYIFDKLIIKKAKKETA